ncbi:phosphoglycerate mutase-like protein [Irpex rosettiformis]|uniref:Phosphoglycerate mutase-like protein n=1 Tax=Irpex rosettiformis TaxID=378272 RepID=A0ACB8U8S1_9APHY|nr:phosphoglycerate mutase-like protein [Irpex rosettiformis]
MSHPEVHGVVVLARNGDRSECYQHPITYKPGTTESTPLGEVQAHLLGSYLRDVYFNPDSSSHIHGISTEIVNLKEVHVRVKVGGEGASVFDSATAVLQGLFPPNPKNSITLANETTVVAPLGGYQYVPVETVEPSNDRSLESWTDCPSFQNHVKKVLSSDSYKKAEKAAAPFLNDVRDFVFGRPTTMENIYNLWDYMSAELVHNITYAHRLPPTFIEQARGWADFRENAIFSDENANGIGNVASRTALSSIIGALQRIAFNGDPLQFMLIQSTYQPFISLFHQTEVVKQHPELAAIPDHGSALAIELRRAPPPDAREFLRFKFRNGTNEEFRTINVFGHREDIPLTEFIYRLEGSIIHSNGEWARTCGIGYSSWLSLPESVSNMTSNNKFLEGTLVLGMIFFLMMFTWFGSYLFKGYRRRRSALRLRGEETGLQTTYGAADEKASLQYRD